MCTYHKGTKNWRVERLLVVLKEIREDTLSLTPFIYLFCLNKVTLALPCFTSHILELLHTYREPEQLVGKASDRDRKVAYTLDPTKSEWADNAVKAQCVNLSGKRAHMQLVRENLATVINAR